MNFIIKIKNAFTQQKSQYLKNLNRINFREAILIVDPFERVAIEFEQKTVLTLSGFSGTAWITAQGHLTDYCIKNGEEVEVCVEGLLVIESMTTNVPTRVHVLVTNNVESVTAAKRILA